MKDIYKIFSVVFVITILLKLLDILKNLLIASKLGVSIHSDIYLSLIAIPDSLVILIGLDTIRGVVNSELSAKFAHNETDEMWKVFSNLFQILLFVSLVFLSLILLFKENIINILLPGFTGEKEALAGSIALIIFPIFFFKALTGFFLAFFYSIKKFYLPTILSSIISVSVIISIFLFPSGPKIIYNISFGNLFGNFLYFLILIIILRQWYNIFRINFKLEKLTLVILNNCKNILVLVIINQIYLFSRNYIASFFGDGAISSLNYAGVTTSFITMIVFNTVFSVLLSNLSTAFATEPIENVESRFFNTYFSILYFVLPVVLVFIISSKEILTLIYMRGKLNINDINTIQAPFIWESLAIMTSVFSFIPLSLYLAKKAYKTLTIIGSSVYLLGIILNILFAKIVGYVGISVAGFIIGFIYGALLLYFTKTYFRLRNYYKSFLKIIISGVISYIIVNIAKSVYYFGGNEFITLFINLGLTLLLVFVTYYFLSRLLGLEYLQKSFTNLFTQKIWKN